MSTSWRPASAVSRKLPSAGPSGSTASVAAAVFQRGDQASNHIRGIPHGIVVRHTGQQVPLLGRTEHQNRPAQITAQPHQFTQVIAGLGPHLRVGRREVVAFRKGQQPVQADGFQSRAFHKAPHFRSPRGRNLVRVLVDRVRREFDARVTIFAGRTERSLQWPVLECLVADGKSHAGYLITVVIPARAASVVRTPWKECGELAAVRCGSPACNLPPCSEHSPAVRARRPACDRVQSRADAA